MVRAGASFGTTLDYGADSNDKRVTYLLRTEIAQADITGSGVVLEHVFDDGYVIFVNGVEVLAYNVKYPLTPGDGAIGVVSSSGGSDSLTFAEYNNGYRMAVLDASLFNQTTNTVAIMLKNSSITSSDLYFDCVLTNYDFPNVRSFTGSDLAYTSEDAGIGIRGIAPYLPANAERFSRVVENVEYSSLSSGRDSSREITRGGAPEADGGIDDDKSKNAHWLAEAVAASTAEFKFVVTHDTPHSHASG